MRESGRAKKVQARMKRVLAKLPTEELPEGVLPLNPGAFLLERLRGQKKGKRRKDVTKPISGISR